MRISQAHIAGVGLSGSTETTTDVILHKSAVAAGTKALLDAGITYNDVDSSIACFMDNLRISRTCFDTFGARRAPVFEVSNDTGLFSAVQAIQSRQSNCTLVIGLDKAAQGERKHVQVVAILLVSDLTLTSHAFLKDGAICISGSSLTNAIFQRSLQTENQSRAVKTAVGSALRQAQLQQRDIQILEINYTSNWDLRKALLDLDVAPQISKADGSFTGATGFASLCGLGMIHLVESSITH